ncbi:MAG: hypothetical protein J0I32_01365 [Sphingobacteriales bacterium]|nr:hypothetical protein [Sphingobacteriales bacterium]OJW04689.1 MAG: hypothetical protein BGO52_19460 [Sphingobacteriales bacterium 44-61]
MTLKQARQRIKEIRKEQMKLGQEAREIALFLESKGAREDGTTLNEKSLEMQIFRAWQSGKIYKQLAIEFNLSSAEIKEIIWYTGGKVNAALWD